MKLTGPRETCLSCEQEGVQTQLIVTPRGGVCPIHSADFLEEIKLVKPELAHRGVGVPGWPHHSASA